MAKILCLNSEIKIDQQKMIQNKNIEKLLSDLWGILKESGFTGPQSEKNKQTNPNDWLFTYPSIKKIMSFKYVAQCWAHSRYSRNAG